MRWVLIRVTNALTWLHFEVDVHSSWIKLHNKSSVYRVFHIFRHCLKILFSLSLPFTSVLKAIVCLKALYCIIIVSADRWIIHKWDHFPPIVCLSWCWKEEKKGGEGAKFPFTLRTDERRICKLSCCKNTSRFISGLFYEPNWQTGLLSHPG